MALTETLGGLPSAPDGKTRLLPNLSTLSGSIRPNTTASCLEHVLQHSRRLEGLPLNPKSRIHTTASSSIGQAYRTNKPPHGEVAEKEVGSLLAAASRHMDHMGQIPQSPYQKVYSPAEKNAMRTELANRLRQFASSLAALGRQQQDASDSNGNSKPFCTTAEIERRIGSASEGTATTSNNNNNNSTAGSKDSGQRVGTPMTPTGQRGTINAGASKAGGFGQHLSVQPFNGAGRSLSAPTGSRPATSSSGGNGFGSPTAVVASASSKQLKPWDVAPGMATGEAARRLVQTPPLARSRIGTPASLPGSGLLVFRQDMLAPRLAPMSQFPSSPSRLGTPALSSGGAAASSSSRPWVSPLFRPSSTATPLAPSPLSPTGRVFSSPDPNGGGGDAYNKISYYDNYLGMNGTADLEPSANTCAPSGHSTGPRPGTQQSSMGNKGPGAFMVCTGSLSRGEGGGGSPSGRGIIGACTTPDGQNLASFVPQLSEKKMSRGMLYAVFNHMSMGTKGKITQSQFEEAACHIGMKVDQAKKLFNMIDEAGRGYFRVQDWGATRVEAPVTHFSLLYDRMQKAGADHRTPVEINSLYAAVQLAISKLKIQNNGHSINLDRIMEAFQFIDRDSSGSLDKREFEDAFSALDIFVTPQVIDDVMVTFDRDGSGTVEYKEFIKTLFPTLGRTLK